MEARRLEPTDEAGRLAFRRRWCLGTEPFRRRMLEKMEDKLGEHHSGEMRRESAEAKAERLLSEELARLGWTREELETRRKSDPAKLRLRKETTLSIKAIAGLVIWGHRREPIRICTNGCARLRDNSVPDQLGL